MLTVELALIVAVGSETKRTYLSLNAIQVCNERILKSFAVDQLSTFLLRLRLTSAYKVA